MSAEKKQTFNKVSDTVYQQVLSVQ